MREGNQVSFNYAGIFGHCETNQPALFMQDYEADTCVLAHTQITQESCKAADFNKIALISLLKNDGTTDQIQVKPGENIMKFSLNTHKEIARATDPDTGAIISETAFRQTQFTVDQATNDCTCDDFVLEAHYKVYFKQAEANSYSIEDFEVDLVYGNLQ